MRNNLPENAWLNSPVWTLPSIYASFPFLTSRSLFSLFRFSLSKRVFVKIDSCYSGFEAFHSPFRLRWRSGVIESFDLVAFHCGAYPSIRYLATNYLLVFLTSSSLPLPPPLKRNFLRVKKVPRNINRFAIIQLSSIYQFHLKSLENNFFFFLPTASIQLQNREVDLNKKNSFMLQIPFYWILLFNRKKKQNKDSFVP